MSLSAMEPVVGDATIYAAGLEPAGLTLDVVQGIGKAVISGMTVVMAVVVAVVGANQAIKTLVGFDGNTDVHATFPRLTG